jgi:hypothetical protein
VATDDTKSLNPQGVFDAEEIFLVSDGSLHPISNNAAYEWVLSTPDRQCWIKSSAPSRTNPRYTSSFCVELDGVNNEIRYCDDKGLNEKRITIFCDSLIVIWALGGDENDGDNGELTPRPPKHLDPSVLTRYYAEAKLLRATVALLKQFPNAHADVSCLWPPRR